MFAWTSTGSASSFGFFSNRAQRRARWVWRCGSTTVVLYETKPWKGMPSMKVVLTNSGAGALETDHRKQRVGDVPAVVVAVGGVVAGPARLVGVFVGLEPALGVEGVRVGPVAWAAVDGVERDEDVGEGLVNERATTIEDRISHTLLGDAEDQEHEDQSKDARQVRRRLKGQVVALGRRAVGEG